MENKKRPLTCTEIIMSIFACALLVAAIVLYIVYFCDRFPLGMQCGWLCICAANVLINCIRWDSHTRSNVVLIWMWSVSGLAILVLLAFRLLGMQ